MRINPETLARASSRHPWRTIGTWLLLIVAMGAVSSKFLAGVLTQDIRFTNQPESVKADKILQEKFDLGAQQSDTEFFVVTSTAPATDPSVQAKMQSLKAAVQGLGAKDIDGPVYSYVDAQLQQKALFSPDGHGVVIALQTKGDAAPVISALNDTLPSAAPAGFTVQALSPDQLPGFKATTGSNAPSAFVIVSSPTTATDDPAFAAAVKAIEGRIVAAQGSALATAPYSGIDAQQQVASLISKDGLTTLLPVTIADTTDAIVADLRQVASKASTDGFNVQVAGQATLQADFTKIAEEDLRKGESIGILVALVVLVVVFGSIVAALLPVVMGMFAIAVALGLVAIIGQFVHFNLFVENIVTMIGLAVGIDYSLFIVSRYREERKKGFAKLDAIGATGATANRAVFFSGLTVVLALLGMFIIPTTIFRALAGGAILVTIASLGASMSLLPAILALLGDKINWPRLSKRARVDGDHDPRGGFWDNLTKGVMAHPVIYLTVGVLFMGGLASFYFQLNRGTSQNVTQLSNDIASKQAFLVLSKKFDAGGATDPVRIVVTGNVDSQQVQAGIQTLRSEIADDPRFSPQTTVTTSSDGSTVLVSATFAGDPSGNGAFKTITDLRDSMVPKAFAAASGTTVLVGGNTAFFTDFLHVADQYQWIVLIFVLGLSFILLTVVFRSIVVPIKAILMNLLSVGAAYGAVTLVFQKGVGIGFFNAIGFKFQQAPAIEAWLPLFLFSILFGLSMDYEVFLLSRIREEYDKTRDNTEAVAYGLRTTAGVITGAAIIMVVVFTGFASGRLGPLQQMGFGLAVAVFLDATVVRTLLVPASMRLLGDLNWYLPRWLEWLPKVNVEGHEPTLEVRVPDTPAELVES